MDRSARQIHSQAEQVREAGEFTKALELLDQALVAYQKENDKLGFAKSLSSRFLTLRHLFENTGFRDYLISAKYTVLASVEIARQSNEKAALAIPLYNLAKAYETLGDLKQAVQTYKEALDNMEQNPPPQHNRPAVVADMKINLYTAQYQEGDKEVLPKVQQALDILKEDSEEPDYTLRRIYEIS